MIFREPRVASWHSGQPLSMQPSPFKERKLSPSQPVKLRTPAATCPKAIRRVFYRILLFYVGGVIVIGLLVPYNDPRLVGKSTAASSPFVIAIENTKVKALPSI